MSQSEKSEQNQPLMQRRPFLAASASLVGIATLAACSAQDTSNTSSASSQSSASATPEKKFAGKVTISPEDKTTELNPIEKVTVTASGATLASVEMVTEDSDGKQVKATGKLAEDKLSWTSTDTLLFDSEYTITWHAKDDEGTAGTGTFHISTVSAANEADVIINIVDGAEYGVGQIIQFNFSEPVADRAAIEKVITITGGGDQPGKFRWYTDKLVRYRPEKYWATHSTVNIQVNILGMDIGNGMIGNANVERTFTTGDKRYAYADNYTKTIKLYVNDQLVKESYITLGDSEWPSVVGQLVIMEQAESYYFDSSSLGLSQGDSHYYQSFWATNVSRLTQGGVFVHQALPSAYSSIGVANVSHGCIGMLPEDDKYFFDLFNPGDIVETVNTGYPQADPDDGYGDWNIPFANYSDSSWVGNW